MKTKQIILSGFFFGILGCSSFVSQIQYKITLNVEGFPGGTLILQNKVNEEALTISSSGTFSFTKTLKYGDEYDIAIVQNAHGECLLQNAQGKIEGTSINLLVQCTNGFPVYVNVAGLTGELKLKNRNQSELTITTDGLYAFPENIPYNETYLVTVEQNPSGKKCTVLQAEGSINSQRITVDILCQNDTRWVQDAFIGASNANSRETYLSGVPSYFGTAVSISGNTMVVGNNTENSSGSTIFNEDGYAPPQGDPLNPYRPGAAYVFQKDSQGNWYQDAFLKPSNSDTMDLFGSSVAISGDTIVVGAPNESSDQTTITNANGVASADNSMGSSGAAYVFQKDSQGNWYQDAYLKASNADAGDAFGNSVAISGDTIVVGAINESSNQTTITNANGVASANNSLNNAGAVYVFQKDSQGNWYQSAYLKASNADADDRFVSVAISGDTIVVGAPYESSNQTTITNADAVASIDNSKSQSGAVYVFKGFQTKDGDYYWIQDAYLKASNADAGDWFGSPVAISGNTIVVGAINESSNQTTITNANGVASADNSKSQSGAVYVFQKDGQGDWFQDAYLKPSVCNTISYFACNFGQHVSISGSTIAVTASRQPASTQIINTDSQPLTGSPEDRVAVYTFQKKANGDWVQDAVLRPSKLSTVQTGYSLSVGLSGGTVVVGAYDRSLNPYIVNDDGVSPPDSYPLSSANVGSVFVFSAKP